MRGDLPPSHGGFWTAGGTPQSLWHNARPFFCPGRFLPMSLISDAYAQAATAAPAASSPYQMFILMALMIGGMYFLMIRPQQKRQKEHQNMLSKLAAGDEVVT